MLKSLKLWSILMVAFAAVGVVAESVSPTATGSANYTAGTNYTFTITFGHDSDASVNGAGIDITLPDGWGDTTATIVPASTAATAGLGSAMNTTNNSLAIGWFLAANLPGSAEVMNVTVSVPGADVGEKTISVKVIYGDTVNTDEVLTLNPPSSGQNDIYLTKGDLTQVHKWVMSGLTISSDVLVYNSTGAEVLSLQGDLNGDGITDLIWKTTATNAVRVDLMNANGSVASTEEIYVGGTSQISQIGDMNGDGKDDLIWYNTATEDIIGTLMDGTTITESKALVLGAVAPNWSVSAIGDLNGDGKADLIWSNSASNDVYGYIMDGLDITSQSLLYDASAAPGWAVGGCGDTNGDGKDDVLWNNSISKSVFIYIMDGLTATVQKLLYDGTISGDPWSVTQVGDMNGDGKEDLLWTNSADGHVYCYIMGGDGTEFTTQGSILNLGTAWVVGQLIDLNNDGKSDIVWNNTGTKMVYGYLMDGLSVTDQATLDAGASDLSSTTNPL